MSHFTVMIIGKDPEDQFASYSENLKMEPYVTGAVSEEEKQRFIDYYVEKTPELAGKTFEELYLLHGDCWNGNSWKPNSEGVWEDWSTYNPKSKWDWYQLGGRWTGFLKSKRGLGIVGKPGIQTEPAEDNFVDSTFKKEIDFAGMEADAREEAAEMYDKAISAIGHLPKARAWDDILADEAMPDIKDKRAFYHEQEQVKALHAAFPDYFSIDLESFDCTRDEYLDRAAASSYSPFALVKDGEWYEKGKMGWWGMSLDEMSQTEWNAKVRDMINELPDDTLISIFDCHI